MKKIKLLSILTGVMIMISACSVGLNSQNPSADKQYKLNTFGFGDVKITGGLFLQELNAAMDYYYDITTDDMMHDMRQEAGLPTNGGISLATTNPHHWFWASGRSIIGQWLSGYCRSYAYSGDQKYKDKVDEIIDIMYDCVQVNPFIVIDPVHYSFEKALTSFLDAYEFCGNEKALEMADLTMKRGIRYLEQSRKFGNNGDEWYIICEALYRAANIFKNKNYIEFAEMWEYPAFWDIFYNEDDLFTLNEYGDFLYKPEDGHYPDAFHAYSHLNSFNSAAYAYMFKGEEYYLDAMIKFYEFMQDQEVMATGGFGPHFEHLLPPDMIAEALDTREDHSETQCDTYASVRLSNYLMNFTGESRYGNWEEKLFYNLSLATIPMTKDGRVMYYSNYNTGGASKQNKLESWTCCSGTRLLGLLEFIKGIYFNDTENIYVNMFTDSELNWSRNGNDIKVTQTTSFPKSDVINFKVNVSKAERFSLNFRNPEWLTEGYSVSVNGQGVNCSVNKDGWINLNREWKDGDTVTLTLPVTLYVSTLKHAEFSPFAVMAGPVTLAFKELVYTIDIKNINRNTVLGKLNKERNLEYVYSDNENIILKPYYMFEEGEMYYLYLKDF